MRDFATKVANRCRRGAGEYRRIAPAIRLAQEGMKVIAADLNTAAAQAWWMRSNPRWICRRPGFDITDESAYKTSSNHRQGTWGIGRAVHVAADLSSRTIGRTRMCSRCPSMCGSARSTSRSPATVMDPTCPAPPDCANARLDRQHDVERGVDG